MENQDTLNTHDWFQRIQVQNMLSKKPHVTTPRTIPQTSTKKNSYLK